jgi:hypothetical protein
MPTLCQSLHCDRCTENRTLSNSPATHAGCALLPFGIRGKPPRELLTGVCSSPVRDFHPQEYFGIFETSAHVGHPNDKFTLHPAMAYSLCAERCLNHGGQFWRSRANQQLPPTEAFGGQASFVALHARNGTYINLAIMHYETSDIGKHIEERQHASNSSFGRTVLRLH